jgi:hypothetical protein
MQSLNETSVVGMKTQVGINVMLLVVLTQWTIFNYTSINIESHFKKKPIN